MGICKKKRRKIKKEDELRRKSVCDRKRKEGRTYNRDEERERK